MKGHMDISYTAFFMEDLIYRPQNTIEMIEKYNKDSLNSFSTRLCPYCTALLNYKNVQKQPICA